MAEQTIKLVIDASEFRALIDAAVIILKTDHRVHVAELDLKIAQVNAKLAELKYDAIAVEGEEVTS